MGSEHYCLRWNNHQSNLLGVFSQLLRDESLVDVTLACSEGHSIRAHKVVLSACSSYFQTLFVDHPSRHPIVILKDVHFAELRTLVDFMYKGEVNVEYCQLSALLKTAESLKVKGLAEMTNLGATGADYKQEPAEEPEQTEPTELVSKCRTSPSPPPSQPSQPPPPAPTTTTINTNTTTTTTTTMSPNQQQQPETTSIDTMQNSGSAGAGDERERERDREKRESRERDRDKERDRERDRRLERSDHVRDHHISTPPDRASSGSPDRSRSAGASTPLLNDDCRPSDMTLHNNGNAIGAASGCSRLPSPIPSEPLPGPSNMPPVQQVPLSLKKEVDWGGGGGLADDKSTGESSSDYPRHSHDPDLEGSREAGSPRIYPCMYCSSTFQHQSKLTRHILSHSLETLAKYRDAKTVAAAAAAAAAAHHLLPPAAADAAAAGSPPISLIDFSSATTRGATLASAFGGGAHAHDAHLLVDASEPHAMPMDLELAADGPGVVLCKFCGKSFPDVSSLIAHLPVHTGDRPFKCEFCGKAFKLRHHMKDHCRVHTGERPFRCTLCGKTFSRSTILKAHEKTHYPKYVRKFLSPTSLDAEDDSPH